MKRSTENDRMRHWFRHLVLHLDGIRIDHARAHRPPPGTKTLIIVDRWADDGHYSHWMFAAGEA